MKLPIVSGKLWEMEHDMTKVCYLHLGLHKTASTSIQATFAKNAHLLQERGITYPVFSLPEANQPNIFNHSIPVFSLYCDRTEKYHVNQRWGVQNNIEKVNSAYEEQLTSFLSASGAGACTCNALLLLHPIFPPDLRESERIIII